MNTHIKYVTLLDNALTTCFKTTHYVADMDRPPFPTEARHFPLTTFVCVSAESSSSTVETNIKVKSGSGLTIISNADNKSYFHPPSQVTSSCQYVEYHVTLSSYHPVTLTAEQNRPWIFPKHFCSCLFNLHNWLAIFIMF